MKFKAGNESSTDTITLDDILLEISEYGIPDQGYKFFMRPTLKGVIEEAIKELETKGDGNKVFNIVRKCPEILFYSTRYAFEYPELMNLCNHFVKLIKKGAVKYNYEANLKTRFIRVEWFQEGLKRYYPYGLNEEETDALLRDDYRKLPDSHFKNPVQDRDYDASFEQAKKKANKKFVFEDFRRKRYFFRYDDFEYWLRGLNKLRGRLYLIDSEKFSHVKDAMSTNELLERISRVSPLVKIEILDDFLRKMAIEIVGDEYCRALEAEIIPVDLHKNKKLEAKIRTKLKKKVKANYSSYCMSKFMKLDKEILHEGINLGILRYPLTLFR